MPSSISRATSWGFIALALFLAACTATPKNDVRDPETGALLPREDILKRDDDLARLSVDGEIALDHAPAEAVTQVPQVFQNAFHVPLNATFAPDFPLAKLWDADIGKKSSRVLKILASPVLDEQRVVTLDAASTVRAFARDNGRELWEQETVPDNADDNAMGGGVALEGNAVFVTTGFGEVLKLAVDDGRVLWRMFLEQPLRAAPTVAYDTVYVVGIDNKLTALAVDGGRILWTHQGLAEPTALLGAPAAAVRSGYVVVAYSSGEVVALRSDNGRVAWTDTLAARRANSGSLSTLAAIRGLPVIDRGRVFVTSYVGRTIAFDLRTGDRVWDVDVGGLNTPIVSGDAIFLLSNRGSLVALSRVTGRVAWVHDLPRYAEDDDPESDPVFWYGPVLAADKVWIISSHGLLMALSPSKGDVLGTQEFGDSFSISPVFVTNQLYALSDDAELSVWGKE